MIQKKGSERLTFRYAFNCFLLSMTHGNNFVLSDTAVRRSVEASDSSSLAFVVAGRDLMRYIKVEKWDLMNRGSLA